MGVNVALAVVQGADDHRAVDVALHELHQHFLAQARGEHGPPVGPGHALPDAHPGAAGVAGGGVVIAAAAVVQAVAAVAPALL